VAAVRAARHAAAAIWAGSVLLALVGVWAALTGGQQPGTFVRSFNLGSLSAAVAFATVGAVVARRRPRHPVGWLFATQGLLFGLTLACAGYALADRPGGPLPGAGFAGWVLNWVWVPVYALLGVALLLFPDGRLLSRRWRHLVRVIVAATAVTTITHLLLPTPFTEGVVFDNPLAWEAASGVLTAIDELALSVSVLALVPAAGSLLVRLRRASGQARDQLRWFCLATAMAIVVYVALGTAGLGWLGFTLAWPAVAVAAGVGILRHQLLDIDLVISRAVVVTVLAAFLTLVYLAVVVGIGTLVRAQRDEPLLVIAATAVAALAFQPIHARVRTAADRLVYGRRASPYEVLARFAQRLHDPVPASELLTVVAELLGQGTGADRANAWLRVGSELRVAASWPPTEEPTPPAVAVEQAETVPDADLAVPVRDGDELLGLLAITKLRGDHVTARDAELASSLAAQAGVVLRNARLAAELQDSLVALNASRQRLVTAHAEERRRLERDLHDGVQQQLLGLKAKTAAARARLDAGDHERASAILLGLTHDADASIGSLRDMARGVHPPLLTERGLRAALAEQARDAPLEVHVDAAELGRLPVAIETAIYFTCLEAVTNTIKHAAATRCDIRLASTDEAVTFAVCDNGCGFDATAINDNGGLMSMRDRVTALGGQLVVDSRPGHGTRIQGRLALPVDQPS
jgi:signal transduction histidine kinase